jgi:GNAT superfamily N-acetyltransferase
MVDFLPTNSARPPACPCGSSTADRRAHTARHMRWAEGQPIPVPLASSWPLGTLAVVTTASPARWRWLAYETAEVARRAGGYDAASFPAPSGQRRPDAENTRALLYRHGDAVAGYLVLVDAQTAGRYDLATGQSTDAGAGEVRPTVGLVFVAYHLRRAGIGRALVQAAAERAHVAPSGLAWWSPFTDDGAALARAVGGQGVWVA